MARYVMLAFSGPTDGQGDAEALEHWYETVHLPEILADEEVVSARRYKVVSGAPPGVQCPYVSIYEMDTDDMEALTQRQLKNISGFHPALDRSSTVNILTVKVSGED